MPNPKIKTFREITPQIYSWTTTDLPKYAGWEKIGYTAQEGGAQARIAQQASQLSIRKKIEWVFKAAYMTPDGGRFTDHDFHAYLRQQGIERDGVPATPERPKRTEWHQFEGAPKTSRQYFLDFASGDVSIDVSGVVEQDYELRPEQDTAVTQALEAFGSGKTEVLWNAKPRFGKTLTTYDLMRRLGARRVLIVTNRPAIANSWLDDFLRFIGHQTTYRFVSDSASLNGRPTMSRDQWSSYVSHTQDEDPRIVEFLSLQDLKGSVYFGGRYEKLKHIAQLGWDLLVIDEAHEGVDTTKTDVAFDQIKRAWTLHLSGTPFKALASGKFDRDQIFNWTYEDEQSARAEWGDPERENPYEELPTLNLLTYQVSRMISERLAEGVAIAEDEANIDYAFDLGEFFRTKDNGYFEHEADVQTFLDRLSVNEKYPFSTPELRDEIRHSFWLLDRVASAKALQRMLNKHEVFKDYVVVLAAGDGRGADDDSDLVQSKASLGKVRDAIAEAEKTGGRTITLSVGQLTTGVTIPEWTAVVMLSNVTSPALYMQAAFRAQNPCTFERDGQVFQKKNAYIFDFAPERTLTIFDEFANNLRPNPSGDEGVRRENIRTLLNFFPVIGEDAEGRMVELDASEVLTFPKVFKAREVVRRGFLSNLLFANVAGIFRYSGHLKKILDKLPTAEQGKLKKKDLDLPEPMPNVDRDGNVEVDMETVINPKVAELGTPVWRVEDIPATDPEAPAAEVAKKLAKLVSDKARDTREKLEAEYALSKKQVERDEKGTEAEVVRKYERVRVEHEIASKHLQDELAEAPTEADAAIIAMKKAEQERAFQESVAAILIETTESITKAVVEREEKKKEQKRADQTMDDARSHLRGFARTIPMFLMAYGDRRTRLSNFDDYTPDDVFEKITGISEAEFRLLRDGQQVTEADGTVTTVPGLFDEAVFDQSIQEFLDKKEALADYFDHAQTENIFAYIPQQKTSLVFTPQPVVKMMVDILEKENPGIFSDPEKNFGDLFSTAGLFLMELVRRLDTGLADRIPDQEERLKHILTSQLFEMSHNEIFHEITLEAVSGGVEERKEWLRSSGHFRWGNLAEMTSDERKKTIDDMLTEGN
ncbi:DEAD/DEAH box helicase family protein [Tersicoccus sp. Bi-70]|uniref:DEAD/DEAH box helicase family protein n=1 Tax=Tersicoccus sp. Bi-70 TaxID=1897634 RepID=UPI0009755DBE|nr:DEAD/DEAH box helicase family protein [Tersicoccus sp. Bi-70]OMH36837.1 restriction endonuclease subunit R [Tersicoccus sp. Bi-70]